MARSVKETLLGQLAIRARFITEGQLEKCLSIQDKIRRKGKKEVPKIGSILAHRGYLTPEQVKALVSGRFNEQKGMFGEIAIRLGFIGQEQLDYALARQEKYKLKGEKSGKRPPLLGKILAKKGYVQQHQVVAVLATQGKTLAECEKCKKSHTIEDDLDQVLCKRCGGDLKEASVKRSLDSEVVDREERASKRRVVLDSDDGSASGAPVVDRGTSLLVAPKALCYIRLARFLYFT